MPRYATLAGIVAFFLQSLVKFYALQPWTEIKYSDIYLYNNYTYVANT